MTRYFVYAETERKPVRKFKHEYEAMNFISDFKNLQQYGCMRLIKEADDDGRCLWNPDESAWEADRE